MIFNKNIGEFDWFKIGRSQGINLKFKILSYTCVFGILRAANLILDQ